MGFTGGFEDFQVNENTWQIIASGNKWTSKHQISKMLLLRSADIAIQNGFEYFAIITENEWNEINQFYTPQTSYTTGSIYGYGDTATLDATTTTSGGYYTTVSKPNAMVGVKMFKEKPAYFDGLVFEAKLICKTVGEILDAKCGIVSAR